MPARSQQCEGEDASEHEGFGLHHAVAYDLTEVSHFCLAFRKLCDKGTSFNRVSLHARTPLDPSVGNSLERMQMKNHSIYLEFIHSIVHRWFGFTMQHGPANKKPSILEFELQFFGFTKYRPRNCAQLRLPHTKRADKRWSQHRASMNTNRRKHEQTPRKELLPSPQSISVQGR